MLPLETLSEEELRFFQTGTEGLLVGVNIFTRMAHIYRGKATPAVSLCNSHRMPLYSDLKPYQAGDRTCKRCLTRFRSEHHD